MSFDLVPLISAQAAERCGLIQSITQSKVKATLVVDSEERDQSGVNDQRSHPKLRHSIVWRLDHDVICVPNRDDYFDRNIASDIWWSAEDIESFRKEASFAFQNDVFFKLRECDASS